MSAAFMGLVGAAGLVQQAHAETEPGPKMYTKEEVAKHKTPESRIWVTYKDGVYDITDFVALHPGGAQKIMLAAGGPVDPFWAIYQQHGKAEVADIIKDYRIGTLVGGGPDKAEVAAMGDPWVNEPERHPALITRTDKPCNAETPNHLLAGNLITPTELFFVRNHLPVPTLPEDPGTWRFVVEGEGLKRLELSVDALQKNFKKYSLAAVLQCSGNRRAEMSAVKPVKGLSWDQGAIGTAVWGGARLRDVLLAAGLDPEDPAVKHIHFVGADTDTMTGDVYATSIPVEIAMGAHRDVLLAYEMNGEPLTRDHGAPLRVVVPGVTGARSVKWLVKVTAASEECSSHWQQKDYKSFCPSVDWDTVNWGSAPAIHESPVTSAITEPSVGTTLPKGTTEVTMRGYAWSGGGREVARVDVSADGGKTWGTAELKTLPQRYGRAWAWTLWEASVPIPKGHTGPVELVAKATDSSYNSQPDTIINIWNLRGVVNNAWHRVKVDVEA